ncbi:hypothetical protein HPB50_007758 [Hyalomma asiaticum]|uniref:Uncharacterized protein n=1 Tax=Hyalomma asiaticum TaxID=266040 RepID=A0ACB7TGB2_HYAAI|nr:hypothetical protein HPB50_007758 [Hyalomma asiaticum]
MATQESLIAFASELDSASSTDDVDVLRVALNADGDAYAWLTEYSEATRTSWIVDSESTSDTRATFMGYFQNGLGPAAALDYHRNKLANQENGASLLANSSLNPRPGTLYHWYRLWKKNNFGADNTDPLTKLEEKMPFYSKHGVDVRTSKSEDESCWAVLVVTPIMKRTQALHSAREIVFLDSTASCDESQSNVTVVLVATPVGALPIAVLLHNAQSTDSYSTAFGLLKKSYPLCFGGTNAPQAVMTDNSAAEKAALCATWPESKQLLCHFHVAQAEWRWLQASRNNVSQNERRELMTAFQKVMYASSMGELDAAVEQLKSMTNKEYVQRVEKFLQRKAEWVLLFRSKLMTRGHNTNNFAEASIRILKDVVLHRRKAYNAVALVDLVVEVWEAYFKLRLLDHAYSRVPAHELIYHKLLDKMPQDAAKGIKPLGSNRYEVPSAQLGGGKVYEVCQDFGTCTCPAGQHGAFCKHQALVHHAYGGSFPNAPAVTTKVRHQLGLLALGKECPEESFFRDFHDALPEQPCSSSMSAEQGMLAATEEPLPLLPMDIEPEADVPSASSNHSEVRLKFVYSLLVNLAN